MAAASSEAPKLSRYDAITRGAVATCQNSVQPSDELLMNTAANGMSTISERYESVTPIDRPKPGSTRRDLAELISPPPHSPANAKGWVFPTGST